ncbi:MAG: SIMPL domain-containing protein, partial [Gemmatimonadetes bacterium]|nr:SIMPL domain-containing protein [Gemmatimonadota bacterium]
MKASMDRKWLAAAAVATLLASAVACGAKDGRSPAASTDGGNTPVVNLANAGVVTSPGGPAVQPVSVGAGEARAVLFAPSGNSGEAGIWVSGQSSIDVEPDLAIVMLGVEARELTVAEARDAAAGAMTAVREALKGLGVAENDIVTTSFSITPQTVWVEVKDAIGTRGEPRITGYIVSNSLRVKVRNLDEVGEVVDSAAEAGGNLIRVNSISFAVDDPSAYAAQLRQLAAADAKAKAELYATAMGVQLGPLAYLSETGSTAPVMKG